MKNYKRLFWLCGIAGFILYCGGIGIAVSGSSNLFELSGGIRLFLKIFGSGVLFTGVALIMLALFFYFKSNKCMAIAEKDERNIAIRGKAAQISTLITALLLLALVITCLMLDYIVIALLICCVMLVGSFTQMILIGYFNKKM